MFSFKNIALVLISPLLTMSAGLADNGATLHQANCIKCHSKMTGGDGSVIYKREENIVNSKLELDQRVTHCSSGADTGWGISEISAVAQYLNKNFYKFP